MQTKVDGPTVARIWKFLRDAHFIDASSHSLRFRLAALNSEGQSIVFWSMRLSILPSGRLQSHAEFLEAPLFGLDGLSERDSFSLSLYVLMLILTIAHIAFISGLCTTRHPPVAQEVYDSDCPIKFAKWFRVLSQLAAVGLVATVVIGGIVNSSAVRQVNQFSSRHSTDSSIPFTGCETANMYHDLLAPARMLLPAKEGSPVATKVFAVLLVVVQRDKRS